MPLPDFLRTVYARLTAGGSTEAQAIQSGVWVAGINVGDRLLQLLKVVVLARLLSPEAFGLLGIALLVMVALRRISQLGFDQALIYHRDDDVDAYLNTAWVMKTARGATIAAVAFLAAPLFAAFFGEPQAEPLIQVIGLSPLFLGLQNPGVVYFQKNLDFHKEFVYQIAPRLVDFVVAVAVALAYRSVWALVAGVIATNLLKFGLSFVLHDYRPSVAFDLEYAKEMFGFGKWVLTSGILTFLYSQGDDVFVGWFFTATTLGFYQIAYRFSNAPATEVTHVISRVAFPTFSKVQDDVERLREGYLRAVHLSTIVAFPMAAGIAAVAPQFVPVVFGEQWEPMVPLMQALAVWGAFRAFSSTVRPVFKSVGRPEYDTYLQALQTAVIAVTIYPAAEYAGVVGVAFAVVGASLVTQPPLVYLVLSVVEARVSALLGLVLYPLAGSFIMAGVVVWVDRYWFDGFGVVELVALTLLGGLTYVAFMMAVEERTNYEFIGLYRTLRRAI